MCVRKTASKGFGRILKKTNVSIYKENNNASNLIEIPVRLGLPLWCNDSSKDGDIYTIDKKQLICILQQECSSKFKVLIYARTPLPTSTIQIRKHSLSMYDQQAPKLCLVVVNFGAKT